MANEVKRGRRLTPEEKLEHRKYRETVNAKVPKSKTFSQCILAFLTGGAICCIGQLLGDFGTAVFNLAEQERAAFTSIVLIFAGALLTGIGVYDKTRCNRGRRVGRSDNRVCKLDRCACNGT